MRRAPLGWILGLAALSATGTTACSGGPTLTVRVQSDLAAGLELSRVTVTVQDGGATACPPSGAVLGGGSTNVAAGDAARLAAGSLTVAEVSLQPGIYTVHVGANISSRVVDRCVVVAVDGARVVRVPIAVSCQGVVCPASGGSPGFTQCLNGRCVEPRCDPDVSATHEWCCDRAALGDVCADDGTLCEVASDCTGSARRSRVRAHG